MRARTALARSALAILGVALAACVSASPSTSASESAEPAGVEACPQIDLRSPSGQSVDLTGRWRAGDGGTYYLRQVDSCLWITGFSNDTESPADGGRPGYTNAFFGHLTSDFGFRGWWADMPWGQETGFGEVTWEIRFADVGGQESVTLNVTAVTAGIFLSLVRPEGAGDLRLELLGEGSCPLAATDDGERYELIVAAEGWDVTTQFGLVGPEDELIGASEQFQASGERARGVGDCGPGLILIADAIEALPSE